MLTRWEQEAAANVRAVNSTSFQDKNFNIRSFFLKNNSLQTFLMGGVCFTSLICVSFHIQYEFITL